MSNNTDNDLSVARRVFAISNPGISSFLYDEVSEFDSTNENSGCFSDVSLMRDACFFSGQVNDLVNYLRKGHLAASMHLLLGTAEAVDGLDVNSLLAFKDFLGLDTNEKGVTLSVSVEGVRGNENRIAICGKVSQNIRDALKNKCGVESKIDYKNPQYRFVVYCTEEILGPIEGKSANENKYLLGLKLHSENLDSRAYRVFHHKAGYKGDFAAAFLRVLGAKKSSEKLLVCQGRDGMFAIEAALMHNGTDVREVQKDILEKIPLFVDSFDTETYEVENGSIEFVKNEDKKVTFVSASSPNVRSSQSNSKVANVFDSIRFSKMPLDEYAFNLGNDQFDLAIIRLTRKDERDLNELYYQLSEVLVNGGKALIICRQLLELPVSDRFEEISRGSLLRGHGEHSYVLVKLI
ncbi:hypothetical protein HOC01_02370 [archaeon]|jgi:23S rRNA G2445 N2-methylase RlmL|nr:hypothetical protein [archaeon]MBT6697837.1 hypothetical protein [archaeon]